MTKIVIAVILIIILPFVVRSLKALHKRRKFLKSLEKLCKEKKYKLSKIKRPYRSLFSLFEGESFIVSIGKKSYACKMIAAKKRSRPLYIMNGGKGAFLVKIRFLRIVLFSYTKSFNFGFESKYKKILIINPIPKQLLFPRGDFTDDTDELSEIAVRTKTRLKVSVNSNLDSRELDNGDIIDGYELYNATGFLNALERDCIDKD